MKRADVGRYTQCECSSSCCQCQVVHASAAADTSSTIAYVCDTPYIPPRILPQPGIAGRSWQILACINLYRPLLTMTTLTSLPAELVCEILSHALPVTGLYEYHVLEEYRWDIRHWGRTLAAVARTCRNLRDIAIPLLYSRYETAFHSPVIPFVDRFTADDSRHQNLRHVPISRVGFTNSKYIPTSERLSQYYAWAHNSELESYGFRETQELTSRDSGQIELWRLISRAPNLEAISMTAHNWLKSDDHDPDQLPVWL